MNAAAFESTDGFVHRHIGPAPTVLAEMLKKVGAASLEDLIDQVVPTHIRQKQALQLPFSKSETQFLADLKVLAQKNKVLRNYIGQGYYGTHTPTVILRNILENPAWYTAYTPYQPEISQGRLEALLNFQTMLIELTGLDIASASLLDEATAAAEAMMLAKRSAKNKSNTFFVSQHCHPQTIEVLKTRAKGYGLEVVVADEQTTALPDVFGVLLQYPASLGGVFDYRALAAQVHENKGIVVVATDLLALTILETPAAIGADIAVGSSQRFGVPFGFGGPHAGFMACSDAYKRNMPGRLVGVSKDAQGKPALRLALQTREQHIRREKATSNICTAQALLAIMASMYAIWHGSEGLQRIAHRVHAYTVVLAKALRHMGWKLPDQAYFDTLTIHTGKYTAAIQAESVRHGLNFRFVDAERCAISLDEIVTAHDLATIAQVFATVAGQFDAKVSVEAASGDALSLTVTSAQGKVQLVPDAAVIPAQLKRTSAPLSHAIFQSVSSETDMLRYLRRLADKDLALDRTMIPLGSCTMKLNATTEMIPITWPEFAAIHPFAPLDQTQGYQLLIQELSAQLCEITGYDNISLQPNSGAQGEYAGLLAIRGYLDSKGEHQRNVCLIPASAHGTNPASAQMVGMEVVVVACDNDGNVDLDDLKQQIAAVGNRLAALMITYPSTHGVFEESVTEICRLIHEAGGQVYLDGANMNALVGVAQPGKFGSDVSHLNLHKTFSIPHGGGGPGVGPVAVKSHLAPFLPGVLSPNGQLDAKAPTGPVSAAPFGSAGILAIPYAYITLMGGNGLLKATQTAILSANYIAKRLESYYPILYTGKNGRVAHECIIDIRPIKETSGIGAEDIAKRLMDYGFHAPTMSFPVAGTLMVEPTESESLAELDRFIDAMIQIRAEIAAIESGKMDAEDNVLKNAPHTAEMLLADDWSHPYSRSEAAYPLASLRANKYWVPVGRVDNAYGDRNLICSCPPLSEY